jgi:hypothetical protein
VDRRTLGWSAAFVTETAVELTTRYLAVIHHGRARGRYEGAAIDSWREPALAAVEAEHDAIEPLARHVDALEPDRNAARTHARAAARRVLVRALVDEYPHGAWLADRMPGPSRAREP